MNIFRLKFVMKKFSNKTTRMKGRTRTMLAMANGIEHLWPCMRWKKSRMHETWNQIELFSSLFLFVAAPRLVFAQLPACINIDSILVCTCAHGKSGFIIHQTKAQQPPCQQSHDRARLDFYRFHGNSSIDDRETTLTTITTISNMKNKNSHIFYRRLDYYEFNLSFRFFPIISNWQRHLLFRLVLPMLPSLVMRDSVHLFEKFSWLCGDYESKNRHLYIRNQ